VALCIPIAFPRCAWTGFILTEIDVGTGEVRSRQHYLGFTVRQWIVEDRIARAAQSQGLIQNGKSQWMPANKATVGLNSWFYAQHRSYRSGGLVTTIRYLGEAWESHWSKASEPDRTAYLVAVLRAIAESDLAGSNELSTRHYSSP
jgi:hypothetical protein